MKAILVIDMPSDCVKCNQFAFDCCHTMKREIEKECIVQIKKPSWCPLRPMPKKDDGKLTEYCGDWGCGYADGWNTCLDKIMGETE